MGIRGLIEGRLVHYVLPEGRNQGAHRAAVIVKVWNQLGIVNLTVFYDWSNDAAESSIPGDGMTQGILTGTAWRTSVPYDTEQRLGTWHWIEREEKVTA